MHTARLTASTHSVALSPRGGGCYPILSCWGYPHPAWQRGGTPIQSWWGEGGYPILTWLGYPPSGWMGYSPSSWVGVLPIRLDGGTPLLGWMEVSSPIRLDGVSPSPHQDWIGVLPIRLDGGTPHQLDGFPHWAGSGYPPIRTDGSTPPPSRVWTDWKYYLPSSFGCGNYRPFHEYLQ